MSGNFNSDTGQTTSVTIAQPSAFNAVTITEGGTQAQPTFTITDNSDTHTFTQADLQQQFTNGATFFHRTGDRDDSLYLAQEGGGGVNLNYLLYGLWTTGSETVDAFNARVFLTGQDTPTTFARTGTFTYTGVANGFASVKDPGSGTTSGYNLTGSTGTLTANLQSGAISTSLTLRGNEDPTVFTGTGQDALGTMSGTGTLGSSGGSQFMVSCR
ncbi:MAG: hypothetical protein JOY99_03460 [Sphingomonadaceae bacterium]|nr:hypothetical protein [Sphingomonadaceae bacterium]